MRLGQHRYALEGNDLSCNVMSKPSWLTLRDVQIRGTPHHSQQRCFTKLKAHGQQASWTGRG